MVDIGKDKNKPNIKLPVMVLKNAIQPCLSRPCFFARISGTKPKRAPSARAPMIIPILYPICCGDIFLPLI